jgi:hypothetical protein
MQHREDAGGPVEDILPGIEASYAHKVGFTRVLIGARLEMLELGGADIHPRNNLDSSAMRELPSVTGAVV